MSNLRVISHDLHVYAMLPRRYFTILGYVFEFNQGLYIHGKEQEHN